MRRYTQLTYEQRCQIKSLLNSGMSQRVIASEIGCSQSAVSRELRRNSSSNGYHFKHAQRQRDQRRAACRPPVRFDQTMATSVEQLLAKKHSPEQISAQLKSQGQPISHERVYQHIRQDKRDGGRLYTHCRRQGRKYLYRGGGKNQRGRIVNRVGIEERPAVVEQRSRVGDWEIDTIIGGHQKGVVVTVVERKTRFTVTAPAASKSAADVTAAAIVALGPYAAAVKTITADNGKEFAWHEQLGQILGAKVYFARPYHSWERGLNENTNGLLRQYWPKGMDLRGLNMAQCRRVTDELNERPRKVLGFKTPSQKMAAHMKRIARRA